MAFDIPKPMVEEHEALHAELQRATFLPAAILIGEFVRRALHGHA